MHYRSMRKLQWKFVENYASCYSVCHRYPSTVIANCTMHICIYLCVYTRNNYNNKCNNALGPLVELETRRLGPRTRTSLLIFCLVETRLRPVWENWQCLWVWLCVFLKNKFLVLLFFRNDWTPVARAHRVWNSDMCWEARRHTAITYKRIFVFFFHPEILRFFSFVFFIIIRVCTLKWS